VRVRATNRLGGRYSFHDECLLASQARARGIELDYVTGFRSFVALGRAVRKGEKALWILAPMTVKQPESQRERGEPGAEERRRIFFRAVPVFDVSQTSEIPGAEVTPLAAPSHPINGESHAKLIVALQQHAASLGYQVEHRALAPGGPEGWCDHQRKLIVIADGPANRKFRILVHELAHAHGITYTGYSRHQAEVLVDTIVFSPCQGRSSESAASSVGDSCHQ
jgi:N-terminal domain of anti-restriction factor ArdC